MHSSTHSLIRFPLAQLLIGFYCVRTILRGLQVTLEYIESSDRLVAFSVVSLWFLPLSYSQHFPSLQRHMFGQSKHEVF